MGARALALVTTWIPRGSSPSPPSRQGSLIIDRNLLVIASQKSNPVNLSSETKFKLKERDFSGEVYKNFLPEGTSFLKEEEDQPLDCLPEERKHSTSL